MDWWVPEIVIKMYLHLFTEIGYFLCFNMADLQKYASVSGKQILTIIWPTGSYLYDVIKCHTSVWCLFGHFPLPRSYISFFFFVLFSFNGAFLLGQRCVLCVISSVWLLISSGAARLTLLVCSLSVQGHDQSLLSLFQTVTFLWPLFMVLAFPYSTHQWIRSKISS